MNYIGFTTSDEVWYQAQLDLDSGGLGLRSLSLHSSSAVITCFCSSRVYDSDDVHLTNALDHFNAHVSSIEKLSVNSARGLLVYSQKLPSSEVNHYCFQGLFGQSSLLKRLGCYQIQPPTRHPGYQLFPPHT